MGHTPGPWVVEKPRRGSSLLMVVAEKGGMPGLIVNQGPIEPRDLANARLIAAAPLLLDALISSTRGLQTLARDLDGIALMAVESQIGLNLAAIAKAEGQ